MSRRGIADPIVALFVPAISVVMQSASEDVAQWLPVNPFVHKQLHDESGFMMATPPFWHVTDAAH